VIDEHGLFEKIYREIRPRAPIPEFHVSFYHFANINNTIRLRDGKIYVRISDLLEGAPVTVIESILHILLAKLYRKPVESLHTVRYRRYASSHDLSKKAHLIRQMRGRKKIGTHRGSVYDLNEIFDSLNHRFFFGLLGRPQMTWSATASRQSLGHYDPAHNAIVVSRIFDHSKIPQYAIEYLVYHEMLHLRHPVKLKGSRRCVHSKEFVAEEKLFPELEKALAFIKRL
jgi:predicted metal-dependent hydrolase